MHRRNPTPSEAYRQITRFLQIMYHVRLRGQNERLGRRELAEICQCTEQTIHRDLKAFPCEVPIYYDRKERSYAFPSDWSFPIVNLSFEDALALTLTRGMVAAPGFPEPDLLAHALDKVAALFPVSLRNTIAQAASTLTVHPGPRDYSAAPFKVVWRACAAHETLEIDYKSRSGGGRGSRRIDPYSIEQRDGFYWEVHGWCHNNQSVRTFALDAIVDARATGEFFTLREPEWAAFQEHSAFGGLRGGPKVSVDVIFSPRVASYALVKPWTKDLDATMQPDGSAVLTGFVFGTDGIVKELLRWGQHCLVRGGPELLSAITAEARAVAALYSP